VVEVDDGVVGCGEGVVTQVPRADPSELFGRQTRDACQAVDTEVAAMSQNGGKQMDLEFGHPVGLTSSVGEHIGESDELFDIGEHFGQVDLGHPAGDLAMPSAGCFVDRFGVEGWDDQVTLVIEPDSGFTVRFKNRIECPGVLIKLLV
jgi:hypothetical protein